MASNHARSLERLCANQVNYWGGFALDLVVATAAFVALGPAAGLATLPAIAAGAVVYTFYEYAFHRWLYHRAAGAVGSLHRIHHTDRTARLGAPFFFTMIVFAATWTIASCVARRAPAGVFAATILALYALQSAAHHIAHGWAGTTRLRGPLVQRWRHHHLRHHADERVNFGILTSAWDRLLGTADGRSARRVAASPARRPRDARPPASVPTAASRPAP